MPAEKVLTEKAPSDYEYYEEEVDEDEPKSEKRPATVIELKPKDTVVEPPAPVQTKSDKPKPGSNSDLINIY